jgi:hypothetical protein
MPALVIAGVPIYMPGRLRMLASRESMCDIAGSE